MKTVWWLDAGRIDFKIRFNFILEDCYLLLHLLFNLSVHACIYFLWKDYISIYIYICISHKEHNAVKMNLVSVCLF